MNLAFVLAAAAFAAPTVTHAGGVTTIVQPDAAAPLVHVEYVVRAGLDRQRLNQNGIASLTAETILRTPVGGVPLQTAIESNGGSISFTVTPSQVSFDVEALPEDGTHVLDLFRSAVAKPGFDPATVRDARSRLIERIAENQQVALQVGIDMLDTTLASSANEGLPEYGIPASLAQFGPDDVKAFYSRFYVAGGSYVSAVGRVEALSSGSLASLGTVLPQGATSPISVMLPKLEGASHHFVAERNIASPWLIAQYPAPSITSKDFGAMLVLSAFMQRTLSDMVQMPGVVSPTFASHAIGAVYQFEARQPNLVLYVNGSIGDPNRSFLTALSVANILSTTKLEGSIDDFKTLAEGDFLTSTSTLRERASLAVLFDENGGAPDYVERTMAAIAQTNAADLQRVARSYLGNPTIALVVPKDNT